MYFKLSFPLIFYFFQNQWKYLLNFGNKIIFIFLNSSNILDINN